MHLYSVPLNLCFSIWKKMQKTKITTKMHVHLGYIDRIPCDTIMQLRTVIFCHSTHTAYGILILLPGIQPVPLHWKCRIRGLTIGPPGEIPRTLKKY